MHIEESVLREIVSTILKEDTTTTAVLRNKFPFVGEDTMKLLQNFVWRIASDVAKKKTGSNAPPEGDTREIAIDVMSSVGEHLKDLIVHLVPDAVKKKIPAPPSGTRVPTGARSAPTAEPKRNEQKYTTWPVGEPSK